MQEESPPPVREPVREARVRPSADLPLLPLAVEVSNGLLSKLESITIADNGSSSRDSEQEVAIGDPCHNKGCRVSFDGSNRASECKYHEGSAVFHEGMKYWSCCQRKTSDFNAFLDQEGCSSGQHKWRKTRVDAASVDKSTTCKLDWYQTGDEVVVSVYAKHAIPTECVVTANAVRLRISLVFGSDRQEFARDITLFGIIDVSRSCVRFKEAKVEICLRKDELVSWSRISH